VHRSDANTAVARTFQERAVRHGLNLASEANEVLQHRATAGLFDLLSDMSRQLGSPQIQSQFIIEFADSAHLLRLPNMTGGSG
jgi:hypothetical protein